MSDSDRADWLPARARVPAGFVWTRRSQMVPMRDGVKLAVDVHLPADTTEPVPSILRQTRYYRGLELHPRLRDRAIERLLDPVAELRAAFVASGYAWVDVCVRGSGASFGHRPYPWSPDEIADGAQLLDWIAEQPWSNGRVGATGISYEGTTSEFLLVHGHPALRAVAPRFSCYDVYADIAFPGGIHHAFFTDNWSRFNRLLDSNRFGDALALMLSLDAAGLQQLPSIESTPWRRSLLRAGNTAASRVVPWLVRRVCAGVSRAEPGSFEAAIREHDRNFDVHQGALQIACRDDGGVADDDPDTTIDAFSPHVTADEAERSEVPILSVSGWMDGGYAGSAIKRFRRLRVPGHELVLGPWEHGGRQHPDPNAASWRSQFDHSAMLLSFFDHHVKGHARDAVPVRYFTSVENRWKTAPSWPPPAAAHRPMYLGPDRRLTAELSPRTGTDEYRVDPDLGTGARARWNSLLGVHIPIGYGDRAAVSGRMLVYSSAPLPEAIEVTGQPRIELFVAVDDDDGEVFVYLEDERPSGTVDYVTEGQLRLVHRRISSDGPYPTDGTYRSYARGDMAPMTPGRPDRVVIEMLPTSWLFRAGHRIRVGIAGADADHFARPRRIATLAVRHGPDAPSRVSLPIVERAR